MYDIGTKLICINDSFPPDANKWLDSLPKAGQLYTVRDVVPGQGWDLAPTCAILLTELVNPLNDFGIEPGFDPSRFAEPEELETYEKKSAQQPKPKKKPRKRELVEV